MDDQHPNNRPDGTPPRRSRVWFAAGFMVVFVGALLLVKTFSLHPSGRAVMIVPLWRFYADSVYMNFFRTSLGPATGGVDLIVTLAIHTVASVIGGCVAVAMGWGIRKLRGDA